MQYLLLGLLNSDTQELSASCSRALDSLSFSLSRTYLPFIKSKVPSHCSRECYMNSLQIHTSNFLLKHPSLVIYIYIYENAMVVIVWLKTGKLLFEVLSWHWSGRRGEWGRRKTNPPPISKTHTHTRKYTSDPSQDNNHIRYR